MELALPLYLQRQFIRFMVRQQGARPEALQAAFAEFLATHRPGSNQPPFLCDRPPQFVEIHCGAYFFVPSMTALRLIAQGLTEPT